MEVYVYEWMNCMKLAGGGAGWPAEAQVVLWQEQGPAAARWIVAAVVGGQAHDYGRSMAVAAGRMLSFSPTPIFSPTLLPLIPLLLS